MRIARIALTLRTKMGGEGERGGVVGQLRQ